MSIISIGIGIPSFITVLNTQPENESFEKIIDDHYVNSKWNVSILTPISDTISFKKESEIEQPEYDFLITNIAQYETLEVDGTGRYWKASIDGTKEHASVEKHLETYSDIYLSGQFSRAPEDTLSTFILDTKKISENTGKGQLILYEKICLDSDPDACYSDVLIMIVHPRHDGTAILASMVSFADINQIKTVIPTGYEDLTEILNSLQVY